MSVLDGLLQGIVAEPLAEDRWLILADWLEEFEDLRRAELLRLHRRLVATCCVPNEYPERAAWQGRVVELLDQGVKPCVPQRTLSIAEGIAMTFSFIPPGKFLMGSPQDEMERVDNETQHLVTLTRGFWLGVHQVTQSQWQAVMKYHASLFRGDCFPVETISWADCQEFVKVLSRKADKRFRLPTEAEWEYACRAGTTTPFHFGETLSAGQANYETEGKVKLGVNGGRTMAVGSFPANAWGIFDMHGNVSEWCSDCKGDYHSGEITDPQGINNELDRVLRGGSWCYEPKYCRAAFRDWCQAGNRGGFNGCRVLLCLD